MNQIRIRWRSRLLLLVLFALAVAAVFALGKVARSVWRRASYIPNEELARWFQEDEEGRSELIAAQPKSCPDAPFAQPAEGFIGLLYGDPRGPYSRSRPHQGIDIFSNSGPGTTPVYAAYDGYLTRESGWRSSLIIRVPEDPLKRERQIWLYYTHMADWDGNDFIEDLFPPGTKELSISRGELLGYTGNYSGDATGGVAVHLHFSVVLDDGRGGYRNELDFDNTLDPSPYLGFSVSYRCRQEGLNCAELPDCDEQRS